MPIATISKNEVSVDYSIRTDVGQEFLRVACPRGWPDAKKLTHKVLLFEGRRFTWTGWNSDRNECYFTRKIGVDAQYAKILSK